MNFESNAIASFYERNKHNADIDHIIDFLNQTCSHKQSINFSYEQAQLKAKDWVDDLTQKREDSKNSGQIITLIDFQDGFKFVRVIDQKAKDYEGFHMRHCVSSYSNHQGIYSIRDKNNIPRCTIEVKNCCVEQIKGKANGKIAPQFIDYVIDSLIFLNHDISSRDIEKIGYTDKIKLPFIKEYFENYKTKIINNKEFLYIGTDIRLKKKFTSASENIFTLFCQYNICFDAIKLFIENGADVTSWCNASIKYACHNGNLQLAKLLVENGANVIADDHNPIRNAVQNGNIELIDYLLKNGAQIYIGDGYTLLSYACNQGSLDLVKFLFSKGAKLSQTNDYEFSNACENGFTDIVEYLISKGASVNSRDSLNFPFYRACKNGHLNVIKLLIENGCTSYLTNSRFYIKEAIANNHAQIVSYLEDLSSKNELIPRAMSLLTKEKVKVNPLILIRNKLTSFFNKIIHLF